MGTVTDLLDRDVYLMPDVDQILGLTAGTGRRWIDGYERRGVNYPPIIRTRPTGRSAVTWGEFVEARLLASYRDRDKISLPHLRSYMAALRQRFGTRYPLAHAEPYLTVQGRALVLQIQRELDLDRNLMLFEDITSGQQGFTAAASEFVDSVEFADNVVSSLRPNVRLHDVVVNPDLRFGEPQIGGISTSAVAEVYRGGDTFDQIVDWYELTPDQLSQALEFEGITKAS